MWNGVNRALVLALPGTALALVVGLVVLGNVAVAIRADPRDLLFPVGLPLLIGAAVAGVASGSWFALALWLLLKALPDWAALDVSSASTEGPSRPQVGSFVRAVVAFYRDLFLLYLRVDRRIPLQVWAGRSVAFACFFLYVYVELQAALWIAGNLLTFSINPSFSVAVLAEVRRAVAGAVDVSAFIGVGIGGSLAVVVAGGLFLLGRPSRGIERALATVVYIGSDLVWFSLLYHGANVLGWAAFRVSNGDVDRVHTLSGFDVLYLVLGVQTTVGAPGIAPADGIARLLVTLQIATLVVVAIWLAWSAQLNPTRSPRNR